MACFQQNPIKVIMIALAALAVATCAQPKEHFSEGRDAGTADADDISFEEVFSALAAGEHSCTSCHKSSFGDGQGLGGLALAQTSEPAG